MTAFIKCVKVLPINILYRNIYYKISQTNEIYLLKSKSSKTERIICFLVFNVSIYHNAPINKVFWRINFPLNFPKTPFKIYTLYRDPVCV